MLLETLSKASLGVPNANDVSSQLKKRPKAEHTKTDTTSLASELLANFRLIKSMSIGSSMLKSSIFLLSTYRIVF